jgi:hypothetical protein
MIADRWRVRRGSYGSWRVYRGEVMIAVFNDRIRAFNYAREQAVYENLNIVSLEICS